MFQWTLYHCEAKYYIQSLNEPNYQFRIIVQVYYVDVWRTASVVGDGQEMDKISSARLTDVDVHPTIQGGISTALGDVYQTTVQCDWWDWQIRPAWDCYPALAKHWRRPVQRAHAHREHWCDCVSDQRSAGAWLQTNLYTKCTYKASN